MDLQKNPIFMSISILNFFLYDLLSKFGFIKFL